MIQFFIIPIEHNGNYRGPQYLPWRFNADPQNDITPWVNGTDQWSMKDYGVIDQGVVAVSAVQAALIDLSGKPSVWTFPENLDTNPSPAELSAFEAFLEANFIPAQWLSVSDTWRVNLRIVTAMFLFMQSLTAKAGNPLTWGITLNTRFDGLSVIQQNAILQSYIDLGYDSSVIRNNWTMRIILKNTADQWGSRPILFGFTEL